MKLKYYSNQTFPKQYGPGTSTPRVSFSKSGIIQFNKAACELMELKAGDKITIAQDEDDDANWYVFKDADHGFQLRAAYDQKQTGQLMMNHRRLQQQICASLDLDCEQTNAFLIAGQPTIMKGDKTKYWGLLQKSKV